MPRAKPRPKRRLGARALSDIGPGYPMQRKFPTPVDRLVNLPSGIKYKTSTVFVGVTPDALTHAREERIIKLCSDRARRWLAKNEGPIQATLKALFARDLPVVEINGELVEIQQYEDDDFPDVGRGWEWRDKYKIGITRDLDTLRADLRQQFEIARQDDRDANFVFIDSVRMAFFYAKT